MNIIQLNQEREFFWDDYLIDTENTTAEHQILHPHRIDQCFTFDQGYEPLSMAYPCIVKDDHGYKMYYLTSYPVLPDQRIPRAYEAVLESSDGIHWTRPHLGLFEHPELEQNNVVVNYINDGLCVFYDTNPNCAPNEKYKAVGQMLRKDGDNYIRELHSRTSADGYHFTEARLVTDKGSFDSLNTVFWKDGRYVCYMRHLRSAHNGRGMVRDVSVIYSEDFQTWTDPKPLTYRDSEDYQMYTNNIFPYPRGPQRLIGLPLRYVERSEWTPNCDELGSHAIKQEAMERSSPRVGIAVTDSLFMTSRDGEDWTRYTSAFMEPELEDEHNWIYGDTELAYQLIDSGGNNYYLYTTDYTLTQNHPKKLARYEIRKDGFACMAAGAAQQEILTKPFTFTGSTLHLNVQTTAAGSVYVEVLTPEGKPLTPPSVEVYGNSIDRPVHFVAAHDNRSAQHNTDEIPNNHSQSTEIDLSAYADQPIRLRFKLREARLYSLWFT